jgi:chromosome segregation ATPase
MATLGVGAPRADDAITDLQQQITATAEEIQVVEGQIKAVEGALNEGNFSKLPVKTREGAEQIFWELRKEKEQLRKKEEQLRKEKEQLRKNEGLLLQLQVIRETQLREIGTGVPDWRHVNSLAVL